MNAQAPLFDGRRPEEGFVAAFVAIAMIFILGFTALVFDVGRMYVERRQLQQAADVSAISGVHLLAVSEADAEAKAIEYIDKNPTVHHPGTYNPLTGDHVDAYRRGSGASPPEKCVLDGVDYDCVYSRVVAPPLSEDPNGFRFFFASVLGFKERAVTADAAAVLGSGAPGGDKLVPWLVLDCPNGARYPDEASQDVIDAAADINPSCPYTFSADYANGPRVNLFLDTGGQNEGNFQAADLNTEPACPATSDGVFKKGGGANDYRAVLSGQADPEVPCNIGTGARVYSQPGNLNGPTRQGLNVRGVDNSCMNESAFHNTVDVIDAGAGVVRITDHDNPCLVALILLVQTDPDHPDVAVDTPGGGRVTEFQHPQALDIDGDDSWRFARPGGGASKLMVARRFGFFYITSRPNNPTQQPYTGLFMKAFDSFNAELDGVFDPDAGVWVVKLAS